MTSNARWPFARAGSELIRRGLVALALVAGTASCDDYPLSPDEQRMLAQARAKWGDNGTREYSVEARIVCFCPPHLAQWTRITVRNGEVIAADPVESLPDGFEPELSGWLTVDDEFGRLSDPPAILKEIEVRFDPESGYPTYIRADCGPNVADCGSVHEMRNLQFAADPLLRR